MKLNHKGKTYNLSICNKSNRWIVKELKNKLVNLSFSSIDSFKEYLESIK